MPGFPKLSGRNLEFTEILEHHYQVKLSLLKSHDPSYEINIDWHLKENQRLEALSLLTAIEAAFRIDFYLRVKHRYRDELSRTFRNIHKKTEGNRVRFDSDILKSWLTFYHSHENDETRRLLVPLFNRLMSFLPYRNWLAHGRYWDLKFENETEQEDIYIVVNLLQNLKLYSLEPN